mgnify:CR=1 FL=1
MGGDGFLLWAYYKKKNKNKGVKSYIESGLYTFCTYAFFFFFSLASSMSLRIV